MRGEVVRGRQGSPLCWGPAVTLLLLLGAVPHSKGCTILRWGTKWASMFGVQGKSGGFAFLPG